jgi:ATP-dependent helicase/nuclease subunit B
MAAVTAGHTLLAPNTELAAALFDAVERAHRDAGREVWPTPRVRDFGSWLREKHLGRQLTDATSPRVLSDIEERELWRAVIDSSDVGESLVEPTGAARAARRARRALHEYGIPLRVMADHAATSEEARVFLDWNRQFDERCRQLSCISADELLGQTPPPSAEPVTWIESPVWRPMARQWLLRHGPMLAPPGNVPRTAHRLNTASPAAELAAIADWALAGMSSSERFRAWVCVPDLSLRRGDVVDALDAALAPHRFSLSDSTEAAPYAVAGGTPLAEFAPVRAALETLEASLEAVPFERFSALLRAPELQASAADAGSAALLDLQLRNQGPSEADLATWLALTERIAAARNIGSAAVQRLQGAHRALETLRGNHPMSRWVPVWIAALELAPWALRHRWSSAEYQAAERFRELLGQLATADSLFGTQSRRSAQRILRRAAHDTAFQVQTGVPPIWVSGQLIDPWLNYEGLWVSGCNDQRWPPPVDPIPLIPVRVQRDFGVIAAAPESQLHFALELQNRWAARAGHCVFSYADPGDGRSAAASPLLPDAASGVSPVLPRPHWRALLQAQPQLERLTDELAPAFGAGERTRGVSTLRAQSRCAFRGFAETRLRCERLERPVPGFNDRERGELIHHALEHIWLVLRDSSALLSLSPDAQARLLDDGVARALAEVCRVRDPGPRWRQRESERMGSVLGKWLDVERQRQPFEVEQLEHGTQLAHAGVEFAVRIDRVDRLADGTRVLIDYKTGLAAADWRGERPDNPQLPIYALLRPEALVAVAYGRVNAGECSFIAEAERAAIFKPTGRKSPLEGMPSLAALIGVWALRIENLAADFAAGRAAVAPTVRACKSCRLHGLCRVPAALEDPADSHD